MLSNAAAVATLPAADYERAKKFYADTLGLRAKEEMPGGGGTTFECGKGTEVFVYPSAGAGNSKATAVYWEVDNLEAEMNDLRSKGVTFEEYDMPGLKTANGVATLGNFKTAWFKDSEGNILNIGQKV